MGFFSGRPEEQYVNYPKGEKGGGGGVKSKTPSSTRITGRKKTLLLEEREKSGQTIPLLREELPGMSTKLRGEGKKFDKGQEISREKKKNGGLPLSI